MNTRIPATLVTGFLGSGKTTLINSVLRDPSFADTAVIVNEFGEVGLDQLLFSEAADDVVLMDSGCLCCASNGSLRDTLLDLLGRRSAGMLPPFRRLIVETSGLANPGPLISTLLADSALAARCELQQVLAVVDGVLGPATLERYPEARRQVALADSLVVSKCSPPGGLDPALGQLLRALNAHAPRVCWDQAEPAAPLFQHTSSSSPRPSFPAGPVRPQYAAGEAVHGEDFQRLRSHTMQVDAPVGWAGYAAWTAHLRATLGGRLLRCKGVLRMAADDSLWVVQGVQGHFASPYRLPPGAAAPGKPFIVCIVDGVDTEDLEASMHLLVETSFSP